jgi:hypothetical protein
MPAEFTGDPHTNEALGHARANSGNPGGPAEIGTQHLLIGLVLGRGSARELLQSAELTRTVLATVMRTRAELPAIPEGTPGEVSFPEIGKTELVSGAAIAALDRYLAAERHEPETLLAEILRDDESRASRIVRESGADPDLLRRCAETRQALDPREKLPRELHALRDKLIGRTKYRNPGLRNLPLSIVVASRPNWAQTPTTWIKMEAEEAARQRGAKPRTDDLLVALLATHETAAAYPHLLHDVDPALYDGGRALAAAGLDAGKLASAAASLELGTDAADATRLLKPGKDWPDGTAELLRRLLAHDGNRAARLLRELGADVHL